MQLIGPQLGFCIYFALRISHVIPAISHGLCCVDEPPEACDRAGLGRRQAVSRRGREGGRGRFRGREPERWEAPSAEGARAHLHVLLCVIHYTLPRRHLHSVKMCLSTSIWSKLSDHTVISLWLVIRYHV